MSRSNGSKDAYRIVWKLREGKRHGRHRHDTTEAQARAIAQRLNDRHPDVDHWIEPSGSQATPPRHPWLW